jgi:hypothetical protein
MQDGRQVRKVGELIEDFDAMRVRCEALGDRLKGLALVFGAGAAVVMAAGVWRETPLFAVGSGFALAAAVGFAAAGHAAAQATRAAPRVRPALVVAPRRD